MISYFILRLVDVYTLIIFVYILLSWIPNKQGWLYDVDRALGVLCDPYLNLFRKCIPPFGGIDFSPIVAILILQALARIISIIL